jgi:hypothetical protein
MVVDDVDLSGEKQRRRYLVYDCMMLAGEGISDLRFEVSKCLLFMAYILHTQPESGGDVCSAECLAALMKVA